MTARRLVVIALLVLLTAGCGQRSLNEGTNTTGSNRGPVVLLETCSPTDQAQYVYRPARLQVVRACVHVAGTVVASSVEADGDLHLQVRLDAPYQDLLNAGNEAEAGNLIVEPVCQFPPLQADAIRVCAADPDPLMGAPPSVGEHVWMEGRYILDVQHHGWAELHPLYRWGHVNP